MNYYLLLLSIILIIIVYIFNYVHNISFDIYNKDIETTTIVPINNYEIDEDLIEYLTSDNLTKEINYDDETQMYHLLGKINISAIHKIHIQDEISKEIELAADVDDLAQTAVNDVLDMSAPVTGVEVQ